MNILSGVSVVGSCLWIRDHSTIVISDLHFGFEDSMIRGGVLVPKFYWNELLRVLPSILEHVKPKTIVINGDIKHDFGGISRQEWSDISNLVVLLRKHSRDVIFVRGNHDNILGPIAERNKIRIVDSFVVGNFLVLHGNKVPRVIPKNVKTVIVGHAHPAVRLRFGVRSELFKCFLVGKWKRKNLVVMPSFNPLIEGSDVLSDRGVSPFISKNSLPKFDVFVVDGLDVLPFGKVKRLM